METAYCLCYHLVNISNFPFSLTTLFYLTTLSYFTSKMCLKVIFYWSIYCEKSIVKIVYCLKMPFPKGEIYYKKINILTSKLCWLLSLFNFSSFFVQQPKAPPLLGFVNMVWSIVIILGRVCCNLNFLSPKIKFKSAKNKKFNWRNICSAQTETKIRIRRQKICLGRFISHTKNCPDLCY
jgi:hypothetical protein